MRKTSRPVLAYPNSCFQQNNLSARGDRTYKAVVSPSGLSGSYEWSKQPSDTEVINIYPSDLDCEVRSETTLTGGATLQVRFTPQGIESYAEDSSRVFR